MISLRSAMLLLGASALTGCNLAPHYVRSVAESVPPQWPSGASYASTGTSTKAGMPWRSLVVDAKLRTVIERALAHNQDLAAVANVASARAQYRVQRSEQLPTLSADGGATITRAVTGGGTASSGSTTLFTGDVGVSGFVIDLFGRQKNLSKAAFETYLSTASGARSTRFTVVSETATAYLTLAADRDLLQVSQDQVRSSERTVRLNEDLHDTGLVSGADVADARTLLAQAQADVAQNTASTALTSLFSGSTWSATPSASIPILGGTNRGNLDYARAQVDYYLATYRKAAQTAYRDVADGLARRGTILRQRQAQADLVAAAQKSYSISEARYREGTDSFLTALVAQRTLYSARQTAISADLTDLTNRVTLYEAIGSDDSL